MANEIKIEISAKFEEGGAPSIKSILTQIDKVYKSPTGEEKNDIDILKILGTSGIKNENISFRLLKVSKILNILSKVAITLLRHGIFHVIIFVRVKRLLF